MQETQSSKNLSKENEVRGVTLPNNHYNAVPWPRMTGWQTNGTEQSPDTCVYGQLKFGEAGES